MRGAGVERAKTSKAQRILLIIPDETNDVTRAAKTTISLHVRFDDERNVLYQERGIAFGDTCAFRCEHQKES